MEIVLVDDGSTDSSPKIMRRHRDQDPRMKIITQANRGIVSALNTGLRQCRAPYIARMDADDVSHPSRFEKQIHFLENHPEVAVVGSLVEGFPMSAIGEGFRRYLTWINRLRSHEQIIREIFVESPFVHPSVMMRREWLHRVGGYRDRGWAEDYDLWLRLFLAGAKFGKVPEVLFSWRDRSDRLTRRGKPYSRRQFIQAKAHFLVRGPLLQHDAVFVWGAGRTGKLLSRYLLDKEIPLVAFVDVDPAKIGGKRRGLPILSPHEFPPLWEEHQNPVLLAAVAFRGAREIIRGHVSSLGLAEGVDWWAVA
jgi:glycosyltransferase involved in cell wall biosynthesis